MKKQQQRIFFLNCCNSMHIFTFDDFSFHGRMTIVCHNHPEPLSQYITWKSGIDKEEFDKSNAGNKNENV